MSKQKLFISYDQADEAQAKRILIHLDPLRQDGTIELWHQRCIKPGEDWQHVLEAEIEETDIAVLLVSPNFLASELSREGEVPRMLIRHQRDELLVIPIIVDYCDWANVFWIGKTKVLPSNGKPVRSFRPQSKAWTQVCQELRSIISENQPRHPESPSQRPISGFYPLVNLSLQRLLQGLPGGSEQIFGREEDLQLLDSAYADPNTSILVLVAFGGVGKSALVRHWLTTRFENNRPLFLGVSFYSQGTREHAGTADQFLLSALKSMGDPEPHKGTLGMRGQRLAALIAQRPTILVLDGLEPLQFGPGVEHREGQIKDAGIRELLSTLAQRPGQSLCVVTSRLALADAGLKTRHVLQKTLDLLPLSAARELLRFRGVQGTDRELEHAAEYLGRHALALVLAAEYLDTFKEGRVEEIRKISLIDEHVKAGRHSKSVMAAYEIALQRDRNFLDIEILRVLGLFDRPVQWEWFSALRKPPAIEGVTNELVSANDQEVWEAISRLRQWGLMIHAGFGHTFGPNLDAHPLIREYFGERLRDENEVGWKKAHERLFEYLRDNIARLPESIEEMMPLFVGLLHGCKAGRYHDALHQIYLPAIMRHDQFYAANKLGALGALLSVMTHFFQNGDWSKPATSDVFGPEGLDEADQITVLSHAGMFLTAARGYASPEVEICYSRARDLCLKAGETRELFIVLFGLWRYYVVLGQVHEAEVLAIRLYSLGHKLEDRSLYAAGERVISSTLYFQGENAKALEHAKQGVTLRRSEEMLTNAVLFLNEPSISCQDYCGLALWSLGYPTEALAEAEEAVRLSRELGHAHTLAVSLFFEIKISQFCGDIERILDKTAELIRLCNEEGFALWRIAGEAFQGWALTKVGHSEAGLAQLEAAIVNWEKTGAGLFLIYWATLLADVYGAMGRTSEGIKALDQALQLCDRNDERWWQADILRLKGELLFTQDGQDDRAEACFEAALELARKQQARSMELRAITGLSRLLIKQGKTDRARSLLQDVYGQFTSGFETRDLKRAQKLLAQLAV